MTHDIIRASHRNKAEAALWGRLVCWVVCGIMLVLTTPGVLGYFAWTCTLWLGATVLPSLMLCKAASAVHRGSCKPCRRVALAASTAIDVSCRQPVYGALAVELQLMVVII